MKAELSLFLVDHCAVKACGRVEVKLNAFFTLQLDGRGWSSSRLGRYAPGTHWTPVPVWTRCQGRSLFLTGIRAPVVQPVSRYTDYAVSKVISGLPKSVRCRSGRFTLSLVIFTFFQILVRHVIFTCEHRFVFGYFRVRFLDRRLAMLTGFRVFGGSCRKMLSLLPSTSFFIHCLPSMGV